MMETFDTTYVCPACVNYVPIDGYSMQPDNPPLIIQGTCPGCAAEFEFSIDEVGQLTVTEI